MASITCDNGSLLYTSRYNRDLVDALKAAIPASERGWDGAAKAWRVLPKHGKTLVSLTQQYLGETVPLPATAAAKPQPVTQLFDIRYIGATKERGGGERTAFGWCNGSWSVIFPEAALRAWFAAPAQPDEAATLYHVLAVPNDVDAAGLKTAYRRLARQWHPDVCREAGADDMFKTIQHAWEILSIPKLRARYDAGLALEASLPKPARFDAADKHAMLYGYRSPLRCGWLLCECVLVLARYQIEKILAWEDITNTAGQTLSTSWPLGAQMFAEAWL